jgi:Ser/Thr protein kinase RdoA (MazF antagonist)
LCGAHREIAHGESKKKKSDRSSGASLLAPTSAASIVRPRSITSREQVHVVEADLRLKHRDMAGSLFAFLRATLYRWSQLWKEVCPDLTDAPRLLAVGDLHVENFRTWRDAEGRLVWGVNDFDEVAEMPYAVDLVRLVTALFSRNGRTDSPLTRRRSRLVNLPQSR